MQRHNWVECFVVVFVHVVRFVMARRTNICGQQVCHHEFTVMPHVAGRCITTEWVKSNIPSLCFLMKSGFTVQVKAPRVCSQRSGKQSLIFGNCGMAHIYHENCAEIARSTIGQVSSDGECHLTLVCEVLSFSTFACLAFNLQLNITILSGPLAAGWRWQRQTRFGSPQALLNISFASRLVGKLLVPMA